MASLLIVAGPSAGDYYLLRKADLVIGRDDDCPVQIVDETVSRRHVEIRRTEQGIYCATDLDSSNGTRVNDSAIAAPTPLDDGDVIQIGATELMYSEVDFADGETAFQHYRRRGEGDRSTIIRKPE